jgi:CHAD domain-containing protein
MEEMTTAATDRTYALLMGEPRAQGLCRVAAGRADSALEEFRERAAEDPAAAIHEGRKDLKKVRSALRLVRGELGDERYRSESDRFRDAGRLLSDARDAEAKLETIAALREHSADAFPDAAAGRWVAELQREQEELVQRACGDDLARVAEMVAEGREAIAEWPLAGESFELVAPGLLRAYRRGRKRLDDVLLDPGPSQVHEWRKRVKDLWYMQRILAPLWPPVIEALADEAHELSSLLGDHHDLTVLAEDARGRPGLFEGDGLAELLELARRRQAELLEDALPLGRRVYAERPKQFISRYGAWWEHPAEPA